MAYKALAWQGISMALAYYILAYYILAYYILAYYILAGKHGISGLLK